MPGVEALNVPGEKNGQTKLIRDKNGVDAYQVLHLCLTLFFLEIFSRIYGLLCKWDSVAMQWMKIGQVVEAVGANRKQIFEGREYDFVFDIDIGEGMPTLKLPFNVTGISLKTSIIKLYFIV